MTSTESKKAYDFGGLVQHVSQPNEVNQPPWSHRSVIRGDFGVHDKTPLAVCGFPEDHSLAVTLSSGCSSSR